MAESVQVAVRLRPFNDREKSRNAKLIIDMVENTTSIKDPSGKGGEKKFTFDFSYWSHDCFLERDNGYLEPLPNSRYADQARVFDDLGRGVLDNAWKGFNCSLFAYGQTGSGKSYSMVGYGSNKGIIPVACEELFKSIEEQDGKDSEKKKAEYQVSLSMLEIYNEIVKDLLNTKSFTKGGLKVREHPQKGFYVEQLQVSPVSSYASIESKIAEGTRNRTLAATNMNATSSRAHTIVAITFTQKTLNEAGNSMTKSSAINLVDLAGSERADSTGATGERLKEGSMINKSLLCLGNCIKALADQQEGKNISVPFRDSMLTRLLKNALGGNSKTIMEAKKSTPHMWNLNEDPMLTRMIVNFAPPGITVIGNAEPADIILRGLGIHKEHAVIENDSNSKIFIETHGDSSVLLNGKPVKKKSKLHHNDRLMFGSNQLHVFYHPQNMAKQESEGLLMDKVTFEFAQEEIAQDKGFDMKKSGKTIEDMILQEDLIQMMPMVNEANAMSDELDQKMMYSITMVNPQDRGLAEGKTEVCVKAKNLVTMSEHVWSRNEFVNRKYMMQEIYMAYMEGESWQALVEAHHPFGIASDEEIFIGTAFLYLQSLAYLMDMDEVLAVRSYTGKQEGLLEVRAVPCSEDGELLEDDCVEEPEDLLKKNYQFQLQIGNLTEISPLYNKVWCRFTFLLCDIINESEKVSADGSADLKFKQNFKQFPVTEKFLQELENSPVLVQIWGFQSLEKADRGRACMPTHLLMAMETGGEPGYFPEVAPSPEEKKRVSSSHSRDLSKKDSEVHHLKKVTEKALHLKEEVEKENNELKKSCQESKKKCTKIAEENETLRLEINKKNESIDGMQNKLNLICQLLKQSQEFDSEEEFIDKLRNISESDFSTLKNTKVEDIIKSSHSPRLFRRAPRSARKYASNQNKSSSTVFSKFCLVM